MTRLAWLVMGSILAATAGAQTDPFVDEDAPGATLRFDRPTFAPEGLCPTNRSARAGCAFRTLLVKVDDQEITPSTKRKSYRLPPGEHTVYVSHKPLGSYRTARARTGVPIESYDEHGFPGKLELDLEDGDEYQIYARRVEVTDDNPFGWEAVARPIR